MDLDEVRKLVDADTRMLLVNSPHNPTGMVADDGSGDYVIEINPRLTTSYVGLRALARTNLAAAMLAVVAGQSANLCFGTEQVEFTADGTVL